MNNKMKFLLFPIALFLTSVNDLIAQCAMCRATIETNISNGDSTVGAGLNMGILYLFAAPYLLISIVAFFWYRQSKLKKKVKFR